MTTWADRAAPIIAEVLRSVGRGDMKALRRALREAYPFGQRRYWPYKAWLQEVRRQLGHGLRRKPAGPQADLFEERGRG